ncbi:hypothetical protein GCM10009623_35390 [Nocardioides aestuarii]
MRRRGDFGTLAERAARSRPAQPPPEPAPLPIRHCWVVGPEGVLPALLLGWEQRAAGWWGRTVHPVREQDGRWAVVEEWLPADRLRPAP